MNWSRCKLTATTRGVTGTAIGKSLELQRILRTWDAHAFNVVAPNLLSGGHTIEVRAMASANTSPLGVDGSLGNAKAVVGARSLAVEAVRMIKGNDGTTLVELQ